MAIYEIGDLARLTVNFTDLNGTPADPTTVTLLVMAPDGTPSNLTPTHASTGTYIYDLLTTESGIYSYRFTGTGTLQAVIEGNITVAASSVIAFDNNRFQPLFVFPAELSSYDLPTPDCAPNILSLVGLASCAIDEYCGRIDGSGNGSLVYSTYQERLLLQTRNRNLIQVTQKPIVGVSPGVVTNLQSLAASGKNYYYTGVRSNLFNRFDGGLSGIVAASGRYGYTRNDMSYAYPDLFQFLNPLNLVTLFGGPAPWVSIDIANTSYDPKTGELWIPAGLQLQKYSEVDIIYNAGYNPLSLPSIIKQACAAMVKNALAMGGGTTGLKSIQVPRAASFGFYSELIDPTLQRMLTPFVSVKAA